MADGGQYELLDPVIDAHHHSRLSTVLPQQGEASIDLLARFHDMLPAGSNYTEFSSPHGPTLKWICQFYVSICNYCHLA